MTTLKLVPTGPPGQEFRAQSYPLDPKIKESTFWLKVTDVPEELQSWTQINPRVVDERGNVAKVLDASLMDPDYFGMKNRGLTIFASTVQWDGQKGQVVLTLTDKKRHGVPDGGHTLDRVLKNPDSEAVVKVRVVTGVPEDDNLIAEIAGGLNTSAAVDQKSLLSLAGYFDVLKQVLAGQPYADRIGYKQFDTVHEFHLVEKADGTTRTVIDARKVPVTEILYYAKVFDCETYASQMNTKTTHPTALFGRKEGILRELRDQAKTWEAIEEGDLTLEQANEQSKVPVTKSFEVLISRLPEILELRDQIEKAVAGHPVVGRYAAGRRKGQRVRAANADSELVFIGEEIVGGVNLGWLMPMLGGFRANVEWPEDGEGTFEWTAPLEKLLPKVLDRLVDSILAIHEQENARAEYVGRNRLAWSACYDAVRTTLLEMQLKESSATVKKLKLAMKGK